MSTRADLPAFDPLDAAGIDNQLSADEMAVRASVRQLCDERIDPYIAEWFEAGEIPDVRALTKELGGLGVLGMHLDGYGCAGMSATEYGLACLELEATDSGIRSLVSVQGSLAMFAIWRWGSEDQKQQWLPAMAAGEAIGCFGLTEPDAGSDPGSMRTRARRDGDDWVLDGRKMWITNGSIADVAVVWAHTDDGVRGFVVPTSTPGFSAPLIKHKMSLRASVTSELVLDGVRLPESAMLPEVKGLKGPLSCLNEARYGILWGAMGAARSALRTALSYAAEREQFGKPIAGFQLTQQKLADMSLEYTKGVLLAVHLGRRKDAGRLRPEQVSMGKLNNVREALEICRSARTILGANGDLVGVPGDPAHEQPRVGADLRGHRRDAHAGARSGVDRDCGLSLSPRRLPSQRGSSSLVRSCTNHVLSACRCAHRSRGSDAPAAASTGCGTASTRPSIRSSSWTSTIASAAFRMAMLPPIMPAQGARSRGCAA